MNDAYLRRFVAARRTYIENQFMRLNPEQRKAVLATEGPLLLLAGAGSGKTTVLINRVANILRFGRGSDTDEVPDTVTQEDVLFLEGLQYPCTEEEKCRADYLCALEPAAPWSVLAITFTNKAANELKERLSLSIGCGAESIWAMTFHSACCRILRREIEVLGYERNFTIYDSSDSERLMKAVLKELNMDDKMFPPKYVLGFISREKDNYSTPEDMQKRIWETGDSRLDPIVKAYRLYQRKLKENNALDFDDLIFMTVKLLQENEEVRTRYQRKFKYIVVDEYQDTNHLQYLLTSLLAGGYENLCVVGDDDQSIYRFRGATIENILNFEKQYRNSRIIRLEQNYRSTQNILKAANAVIAHNIGRKGKRLWTTNSVGDKITIYEALNETQEASYVSGQILSAVRTGKYSDHAVLYRTNAQSNVLEQTLRRNGIPYKVVGGMRFFDRAEVKDMLSYLCVINNRNDDLRLNRIINNPPRGLGEKTMDMARRLATAQEMPLYHIVSDPYNYGPLEKSAKKFMDFTILIEGLTQLLETDISLTDFYEEVMIRTGYIEMLQSKPTEENKTRLENIRELTSSIKAYMENTETPTLAGFLEEIALYTDIDEYNSSDDSVVLMTMHAAKGLEFPYVYLVGFEEGLFPGVRSFGDPDELEEERRLCYVAITRAKQKLTISYARERMLYGRTNAALQSRFLKEVPLDVSEKKGAFVRPQTTYSTPYRTPAPSGGSYQAPKTNTYSTVSEKASVMLELKKGDMVEHTAFGKGMVLSVIKMGNDALWEIVFDEKGTKKLMAKAASAHMKRR
ncbi:MAG: ATP-dependent DNA helicase PcrA [Ruminococcaceae bacterium]|nr:ATP-dependent DNA helicase PcrA [Oscillospiraceae bacterium]